MDSYGGASLVLKSPDSEHFSRSESYVDSPIADSRQCYWIERFLNGYIFAYGTCLAVLKQMIETFEFNHFKVFVATSNQRLLDFWHIQVGEHLKVLGSDDRKHRTFDVR